MKFKKIILFGLIGVLSSIFEVGLCNKDDDEFNDIFSPEDIEFLTNNHTTEPTKSSIDEANSIEDSDWSTLRKRKKYMSFDTTDADNSAEDAQADANCLGFGNITSTLSWIFESKPLLSDDLRVEYYFSNRMKRDKDILYAGDQFHLNQSYYKPKTPTVVIVHGFMSYGDAKWVKNMTEAFLNHSDVNVIAVNWSRGGRTWKYWRAVANTRTVGTDLAKFLHQYMETTGIETKDLHLVGHSLGAHICSFAAVKLGGVQRITGLDPAQPCFTTKNLDMVLDKTDANFVDVIHTNGRLIKHLGLGMSNACGHQDFYPNGGNKQPGCYTGNESIFSKIFPISKSKLKKTVCNHGRAYLLFIESLKQNNCTLIGHKWNHEYSGINVSISAPCTPGNCSELGIKANLSEARGAFYVFTTAEKPFCDNNPVKFETRDYLLTDLKKREDKIIRAGSSTFTRLRLSSDPFGYFLRFVFHVFYFNPLIKSLLFVIKY